VPVLVEKTQATYTSSAMRAKLQGFVVIAAVIGVDGKVGQTRVIQSLDQTYGLDDEALRVAKLWRFTPGSKDGVPVPVAANIEIGFSLRDVPPPSTWPQSFAADAPAAAGPSNDAWTKSVIETGGLRYAFGYPQDWAERRGSPSALTTIMQANLHGIRAVVIGEPRKVPTDLTLPMPITQLQHFADYMRSRPSTKLRDTMGIGQVSIEGLWWVWLELTADPSALPASLTLSNGAPGADLRIWSFVTTLDAHQIDVMCFLVSFTGVGDAVRDAEFRAATRDFRNILGALTVSKTIASR
jgi:TonB family protein